MSAKYQQLADILRRELHIAAPRDGKLLTEAELSRKYHMSRQTVRHALRLLEEEGLIQRRQGSGSFLTESGGLTEKRQLAVITTYSDDYIFPKILHDIQSVLNGAGYEVQTFVTENQVSREREILSGLLRQGIGGILAEGSKSALPTPNADLYEKLREAGVPIVFLHSTYSNLPQFPCVSDDNVSGGKMLARYLLEKGHRRIAGVFKLDDVQGPQRYLGMVTALQEAGFSVPDEAVFWYDTASRGLMLDSSANNPLQEHLLKWLEGYSAVICYNDETAHALISGLVRAGKRVPEEIAVVSFDNSYYSQIGPVSITSLGHRSNRTGIAAAQALLAALNGEEPRSAVLDWELIRRNSG